MAYNCGMADGTPNNPTLLAGMKLGLIGCSIAVVAAILFFMNSAVTMAPTTGITLRLSQNSNPFGDSPIVLSSASSSAITGLGPGIVATAYFKSSLGITYLLGCRLIDAVHADLGGSYTCGLYKLINNYSAVPIPSISNIFPGPKVFPNNLSAQFIVVSDGGFPLYHDTRVFSFGPGGVTAALSGFDANQQTSLYLNSSGNAYLGVMGDPIFEAKPQAYEIVGDRAFEIAIPPFSEGLDFYTDAVGNWYMVDTVIEATELNPSVQDLYEVTGTSLQQVTDSRNIELCPYAVYPGEGCTTF
jgi:hypothetical protein